DAGRNHRLRRLHGTLDRAAPALRISGERPAHQPAPQRHGRRDPRAEAARRRLRCRARRPPPPARAQGATPPHRTPDHRRARLVSFPIVELYPAVAVQGGRVARSAARDPLAVARQFARTGARWVNFVDLDGALETGDNRELARRFLAGAREELNIQVGGALATETAIAEMLEWGATRVVIGTRAAIDATLVSRLLVRYGADRLAVGIDARNGRVAARGSTTGMDLTPVELARRVQSLGARTAIYTDAARDGALSGPDLDGARTIVALGLDVIVSGGVASLDDLRGAANAGLAGAIVGRALHEGRFTLAKALACVAA